MSYWRGKVAIVTGGSAGFGHALACRLAACNAKVVIAARDADRVQVVTDQLVAQGFDAIGIPTDVTNSKQVDTLVAKTVEQYGAVDMLVNNAGRSDRGTVAETTPDEFRELLELNFLSMVRCTRAVLPHLVKTKGHLVNMGSLAAKAASRFLGAYPPGKFAVAAYSQQLRLELLPQGVNVLLVCTGPIARSDAGHRYDQQAEDLPDSARKPGGGVQLTGIPPDQLARQVLRACQRRKLELVLPRKARLLFAIAQLSPSLGDWIIKRKTSDP